MRGEGREPDGRQGSAAFSEASGKPIGALLDFALPCQPSMKLTEMTCGDWQNTRLRFSMSERA
jgi:hypothetical protein